MNKILIAGDWHGRWEWASMIMDYAVTNNCDAIVQLGDFGIWPGTRGADYIKNISDKAMRTVMPVYFLDGNHEDFDQLWGPLSANAVIHHADVLYAHMNDGFREILPGLFYMPRGLVFKWGNTRFAAVGGAVSIDRQYRWDVEKRTGQKGWWRQEQLTESDIEFIYGYKGGVDVLLSHDTFINPLPPGHGKEDPESAAHREKMLRVVKHLRPTVNFHGHYHYMHATRDYNVSWVIGLDLDGSDNNTLFYDTRNGIWS